MIVDDQTAVSQDPDQRRVVVGRHAAILGRCDELQATPACRLCNLHHSTLASEPGTGQTFELARAYGPRMETLTASQVGSETLGPADWLHENEEDRLDVDTEGDGQPEAVSAEERCAESPTGRHVPDPQSIRPADGTGRNRGTDYGMELNTAYPPHHWRSFGSISIDPLRPQCRQLTSISHFSLSSGTK